MTVANIRVKDLYSFVDRYTKIHLTVYDVRLCPDFIGKLADLSKHCMYNDIYNASVDRIFYSPEDRKYLNIYVSLREE